MSHPTNHSPHSPASAEGAESREARRKRDYGTLLLKGMAMGSADIVPGVSGGTMALILGIYEELIGSLKTLGDRAFWSALLSLRWRRAAELFNWPFLLTLFCGIALAVLSLSRGLEWLLEHHPVLLWSFFFGLVSASVWSVGRRAGRWNLATVAAFAAGALVAFVIVGLTPATTPDAPWFLFVSGALAVSALLLPGISGAFILLLLGKYEFVLEAIGNLDFGALLWVGLGMLLGLVSFAQLLGWLFRHFHDLTIGLLSGFLLGSLRKIWPWKALGGGPEEAVNVLPALSVGSAFNTDILYAALLALVGAALVLVLDRPESP